MNLQQGSILQNDSSTYVVEYDRPKTIIPRATYRLQFNKTFTFKDAKEIIPYLAKLGISHCYASPILKSNPGSMHGYDIVDYGQFNPEIGSPEDLNELVETLKGYGMGLILDIVPNHMGIGNENKWWQDVLENGPASPYSEYFDINWQPIKKELVGKVLLPILGTSYGQALKEGQLKLSFVSDRGKFSLQYFDHKLPINPVSYPIILNRRLEILENKLGKENADVEEYLSILSGFTALSYLPFKTAEERLREQHVEMRRLLNLCAKNSKIEQFIKDNLQEFAVDKSFTVAETNLHILLEQQAYRLSFWRVASDEINYRRFFDVDSLAAVRTEDARVFTEMHRLIFALMREKKIEGLRIDHPDGLYDPAKYFDDIQQEVQRNLDESHNSSLPNSDFDPEFTSVYIVVEKILAPFEHLANNWRVHGTTGYDYLNALNRLLIDTESSSDFDETYANFIGYAADINSLKLECKDIILSSLLASELNVLAYKLSQIAESNWNYRDFTLGALRNALRQVVKYFPIYRTYITDIPIDKDSRNYIDWAISAAKNASSPINARIYDFIHDVLTLDILTKVELEDEISEALDKTDFANSIKQFTLKFQQYTGPVMAKSIEDTMFYRYNRFVCLNEVGGEADKFGATIAAFHLQNQQRQLKRPFEMISTSTHDTKRSEDVRARLAVLSEIPLLWRERVLLWQKLNKSYKTELKDEFFPDANDEYLIYQNLIGMLPPDCDWHDNDLVPMSEITERLKTYALKAVRESKTYTSWIDQDEVYEQSVSNFIEKILNPALNKAFLNDLLSFHKNLNDFGLLNSLVQAVIKITSPGVPDIYQGCEAWDFSLVDPDNRRPVDHRKLHSFLSQILSQIEQNSARNDLKLPDLENRKIFLNDLIESRSNGTIKLFATKICLDLRKEYPDLFTKGVYTALEISGPAKDHVIAFLRKCVDKICLVVAPVKAAKLALKFRPDAFENSNLFKEIVNNNFWHETKILLPDNINVTELKNVFSGSTILLQNNQLNCTDIFKDFPVGVLIN